MALVFNEMKFSIIVPVYNVEDYIAKCLDSIKGQTLGDFECLIIDDGSKDKSIDIAETIIGDDERFKIYHKENGGLSDARNFGMKKAIGEYLFFADSDDYIVPTLLNDTYTMAMKYNSDIVCFDMEYIWPDERVSISKGGEFEVSSYKENPALIFINNSANNKIYRRSFMADKEFIKGMWYEDLAIIPIWLAKANNVSYVNKVLYYYVQRSGSISHSGDEKIFAIYDSLANVKNNLQLSNDMMKDLYLDNCLEMTTLRIRDINDAKTRKAFYLRNVRMLDKECPRWYEYTKEREYPIKKRLVFFLLKYKMISLLDCLYQK